MILYKATKYYQLMSLTFYSLARENALFYYYNIEMINRFKVNLK